MKCCFVGDIHGKNRSPLDRLKDYNDDLFNKLEWLVSYCNDNDISYVIHLGDIHDKTDASDEWKNRFIQTWKQYNGKLYSIFGNHDIPFNNEQFYTKTCLRNLELSGVLSILKEPLYISSKVRIIPLSLNLDKAKKELKEYFDSSIYDLHNIFVGHHYYEFGLNKGAGFVEEDFNFITHKTDLILGHDHKQYEICIANEMQIFRPGSFMRTELSEYTITMHPRILVYDDATNKYQYVEVPHRNINEIYDVANYNFKKHNTIYFKKTVNALENMHQYLSIDAKVVVPCSTALKQLNCPKEEYEYLRLVYQQCSQQF